MRVFVNYRRADSPAHAGHLRDNLVATLGSKQVFMDTSTIAPGSKWRPELEQALSASTFVIVVIGPGWLKAANEFGVRRLDDPADWVRAELRMAFELKKEVIPVLVGGAELPPEVALPDQLKPLLEHQVVELRDRYWDHDVQLVLSRLADSRASRLPGGARRNPYPIPPAHVPSPMDEQQIKLALNSHLSGWSLIFSPLPEDASSVRQELFKEFTFDTFINAVQFMGLVAPGCDIAIHHPRWENLWKTLRVYLTTWDIGHRVSDRDIQLAAYFDRAYQDFTHGN